MTDTIAHEKYAIARYAIRTAQDLLYDAKFQFEEINPAFAKVIHEDIDALDDTLVALRHLMEGLQ